MTDCWPVYPKKERKKLMLHTWWRHQMETSSALLALCAGNFTGHCWIPLIKASDTKLWFFFDLRLNKRWVNNREVGDLRRHRAHYDVTVMSQYYAWARITSDQQDTKHVGSKCHNKLSLIVIITPCVSRPSSVLILIISHKRVFVTYEDGCQAPSQSYLSKYILSANHYFLKNEPASKGFIMILTGHSDATHKGAQ